MRLPAYECSNCGAPLSAQQGASLVICVYCKRSYVAPVQAGSPSVAEATDATGAIGATESTLDGPLLVPSGVSEEQANHMVTLVVAGQRDQAISLYESLAQVDTAQASAAVNALTAKLCSQLTSQLPLNRTGCLAMPVAVTVLVTAFVYSAKGAVEVSRWYWFPAALTGLLAWLASSMLWKGATMNLSLLRGGKGEAVVLRTAVLSETKRVATVLVQWRVQPNDSSALFVDEEAMQVAPEALRKLAPGNVVSVEFNRRRDRVFPFGSTIKVLRTGAHPHTSP